MFMPLLINDIQGFDYYFFPLSGVMFSTSSPFSCLSISSQLSYIHRLDIGYTLFNAIYLP
jgi:hypothetical protein